MTRVGLVGMWHETNTYSPRSTTLDDFARFELDIGQSITDRHAGTRTVMGGFLELDGIALTPVFSAGAWPAGPVTAETADQLLGLLQTRLEAAGTLDGVLVNLHGAMVADGHPDMEADTIAAVRGVLGKIPVVTVVDFHANPSVRFVENADVVIGYDTYPHVDMFERGVEAGEWILRLLAGEAVGTRIGKHPVLTTPLAQWTDADPFASLFRRANEAAAQLGVERVGITGGFAYSDTDRAGISVLATTATANSSAADEVIARVMADIDAATGDFTVELPSASEAVASALEADQPVVLADIADNIGGGSSGDGTALLDQLLAQGAKRALCVIADASVAARAHELEIGATFDAEVGGKTDEFHGSPVAVTASVKGHSDGRYTSGGSWGTGQSYAMGPTAWLDVEGIDLVVTTVPTPPFHIEQVTHLGLDPARASIIVAKGAVAWRSAFGDIAKSVIEVDTPGVCPIDVTRLPRTTEPVRYP